MSLALRPATVADDPFLRDLYAETRSAEFSGLGWPPDALRAFLDSQYEVRRRAWAAAEPTASDRIVEVDGRPVGRLLVAEHPGVLRLVDIGLLPAVSGQGIGTTVLGDLVADADSRGLDVQLHVRADSPARRLYARLGFVPDPLQSEQDEPVVYVAMSRRCRLSPG